MSRRIQAKPAPLPSGFADFYRAHHDFVWRCAQRLGGELERDGLSADDLVQDCFIVALRRFGDYDPEHPAKATTWLFAILRNVLHTRSRTARRQRARHEQLRTSARPRHLDAARGTEALLAGRLIDEFLGTLDADKRAVFTLVEIEGMSGAEAARCLQLNPNTASARLRAARAAFRRHFADPERARAGLVELGGERASPERRERSLGLIALAGLGTPSVPVQPGLPTSGAPWLSTAGLSGLSLVVIGVAGAMLASLPPAEAPRPRASSRVELPPLFESSPNDEPASPIDAPPDPAPAETSEPATVPAKPSAALEARPAPLDELARAREDLLAGDATAALARLEGQTFPPALESRRVALELGALCALERPAQARRRAAAWTREHPDHPGADALVEVCWSETSPTPSRVQPDAASHE